MTSSTPEPESTEPAERPSTPPAGDAQGPDKPGARRAGEGQVVIVGPEGVGVVKEDEKSPLDMVEQPAKVMRIGNMIKQLLDEVRNAPLDDAGRTRLAEVHQRSISELEDGLSEELVEELRRITLPFGDEGAPTDAELRIAQAQLVGWLEGLFHGIQTALVAQQMATQQQITQMRRALPGGPGAMAHRPGHPLQSGAEGQGTGQYL